MENFKNGLKKVIKGLFAIFVLKIAFFAGIYIFQSCQPENEDIIERDALKTDFLTTLSITKENLNQINLRSTNNLTVKNQNERLIYEPAETICLQFADGINVHSEEEVLDAIENNLNTVTDLIELNTTYGLVNSFGVGLLSNDEEDSTDTNLVLDSNNPEDCLAIIEIPVQPVKDAMEPSVNAAKQYLRSKGLNDKDIQDLLAADEDGPAMSESNLIPTVMLLIAEEQNLNSVSSSKFYNFFIQSAYASQIGECAGDALGISAIAVVLKEGLQTKTGKRLLKKAIRKVASRALGWVGAAIFVYEFGDCMNWW